MKSIGITTGMLPKSIWTIYALLSLSLPFVTSTLAGQNPSGRPKERPNIIFILTDDQRFDALGYAGNPLIHTPEMDKLARSGVYFDHAIVTTPICSASRASIFSGLHERTHKYTFQTGDIRSEYMASSYPKLLREAGYYTGFFGKFGVNYAGKDAFFDVIEDYDRNGRYADYRGYYYKTLGKDTVHLTRYTGERALEFINRAPKDRPFCLSLSFSAPHAHDPAPDQYFWEPDNDKLFQNMNMPGPDLADDAYFLALPPAVQKGFNRTRWHWRFDTPTKYQHSVKGYYRMIAGVDREIGKIRQLLQQKGLDKNTVIILMGDNGYFLGERQLAGKWLLYDNSIRVPLIIFDPRQKKHLDLQDMALNIDIPATILDIAAIPQPANWQGKSLYPLVSGRQKTLGRDTILIEHLWEFANIPPSEGIRTREWKYFRYVNDKRIEELYYLPDDPKEIKNLAGEPAYRQVLLTLRRKCDELIRKNRDPYSGVPHGLTVEYIRDPENIFIRDARPEYGWTVPGEAVTQSAYQILVASTRVHIEQNIGDVWDSGQTRGSVSVNIPHGGAELKANATYYWKVRIWDQDNRLSDYSSHQSFQAGSFGQSISTPNRFQVERISPLAMKKTADHSYFIDFGKAVFGNLELHYTSDQNDTLLIRLGEKLLNGAIDRAPGGTIRYQEIQLPVRPGQDQYLLDLPADKRNTNQMAVPLPDSFGVITPFRYVEIERAKMEIRPSDVRQKAYFHYFEETTSSFTSSDTLLNQIWDICKYSMKATSFAGLYVDGDRERIPYEADAYINQLGHYCTDQEYAMARQTIEYFMEHPTWPTEWLLHTALLFYQDYYYTGDTELIAHYYDRLRDKTLLTLAREDGLISSASERVTDDFMRQLGFSDPSARLRDIVDWPPAQKDTGWKLATAEGERDGHEMLPINTVVNSFFYQNLVIMAEFADLLNRSEDRNYFQYMAAKVKKTINEKLLDREKGIYVDGEGSRHSSQHANMLPLAFGIVPAEHVRSVAEFVKSRGMACSVYGAQYLLEGLYRAGEAQYALDLMRYTGERSWWNMIRVGSTITLEAWDMKYKPNSDWNHAWGAAPANIIPRFLWGITPQEPGFGVISIKPQMCDLKQSAITVPTIRGPVKASYTYVNPRQQEYTIEIPANTVAEFFLTPTPDSVITLNGRKVNPAFGSIRLEPGQNRIEMRINSF